MTRAQFQSLPLLMLEHQVLEVLDYSRNTLAKMVECGVLSAVQPAGCGQRRFQKVQVAALLGLEGAVDLSVVQGVGLMSEQQVALCTGYSVRTLAKIALAEGLTEVRLAGTRTRSKYRKSEIAHLVGVNQSAQSQTKALNTLQTRQAGAWQCGRLEGKASHD